MVADAEGKTRRRPKAQAEASRAVVLKIMRAVRCGAVRSMDGEETGRIIDHWREIGEVMMIGSGRMAPAGAHRVDLSSCLSPSPPGCRFPRSRVRVLVLVPALAAGRSRKERMARSRLLQTPLLQLLPSRACAFDFAGARRRNAQTTTTRTVNECARNRQGQNPMMMPPAGTWAVVAGNRKSKRAIRGRGCFGGRRESAARRRWR